MKNSSWRLHVFKACRITKNIIDVDIYIIEGGRNIIRNHVSEQ